MYIISAKTAVKPGQVDQKRKEMRSAYDEIIQDTISFSRVAADKTPYFAIVDDVNGLISNYNTSVTIGLASRNTANGEIENMVAKAAF